MEPKIRFKGFEGEWKKVKFLEIFEFLKNNSLSRAELSSKGDFINIHYGDILIKYGDLVNIQNEELTYIRDCRIGQTLYKMCSLQNGDIIIADAAEDYSVGKCSEIVNIGNNKVVSGLHTIPCRPLITFAQGYLGHYINSNSYHNQLLPLIQGSKISSISKKALSQTSVFVPSYEEQQTIASYFRILDAKLQAYAKKVESLKKLKSASLVAMFPQNGESTPKVRFKGFEGEWKKVKLGNVCSVNRGTRITKKELNTNQSYPVYQNTNYPLGYYKNYNVEANNPYVIIGGSAGLIGFSNVPFWAADDCAYFGDNDSLDKAFLYSTLLSHIAEIKKNVRGSSVPRLDRSTLIDLEINLPSFSEQQAIASFFHSLDRKIALETARLEKLKQIKLACLDKMFV